MTFPACRLPMSWLRAHANFPDVPEFKKPPRLQRKHSLAMTGRGQPLKNCLGNKPAQLVREAWV